jgi:hypothetical protein
MVFNILVHVFDNLKWPNCSGNMYIGLFRLTGCSEHVGSDSNRFDSLSSKLTATGRAYSLLFSLPPAQLPLSVWV